ncbi:MAG: fluoride efflux transporter CrcB [Bacteroidia bacterium]
MNNILAVFIGGGLGSLARYGISIALIGRIKASFPVSTFCSNILSCFILAITVFVLADKTTMNPLLKFFIVTGFCGGFSTFSTFSFETVELFRSGDVFYALLNILISLIAGIAIIYFFAKNIQ